MELNINTEENYRCMRVNKEIRTGSVLSGQTQAKPASVRHGYLRAIQAVYTMPTCLV